MNIAVVDGEKVIRDQIGRLVRKPQEEFPITDKQDKEHHGSGRQQVLICPICGKSVHLSEYEKVMKNIRQAVFRGWTCRIEYENEDDGRKRT